jgi:saccharopine dehydrogenase (NAD+, L-lysine-forming)
MRRARFWMTFGDAYIKHMEVLVNVGMTGIHPVKHKGVDIIPIEFLKTLLNTRRPLVIRDTGPQQ